MSNVDYRVISIGTLSSHPLWNEPADVRTGHATTTLIDAGDARILVNPALPARALLARLSERTPHQPESITHVFLTSFATDHRRALAAFDKATWLLAPVEFESAGAELNEAEEKAEAGGDEELLQHHRHVRDLLSRCEAAEDSIARGVDLFPLPGVTAGTCGLLLPLPGQTVLIAGDAVLSAEHLHAGRVSNECHDVEQARESFREAVEIADVIISGRDNLLANPLRRVM